jgi:flagellar biosynthesis anti-sigma factor FlgM
MKGITGNPALDAYHRMAISPVGATRPVERPEAPVSTGTASPAAEVSISARARDLASESTKVDAAKVEGLKQQIAEGKYRADSQVIAQRMIEQLG